MIKKIIFVQLMAIVMLCLLINNVFPNQEWDTGTPICKFNKKVWEKEDDIVKGMQIISVFNTEDPDNIKSQIECLLKLTKFEEITALLSKILSNREYFISEWNKVSDKDFTKSESLTELVIKGVVSSQVLIAQVTKSNILNVSDLRSLMLEIINTPVLSKMSTAARLELLNNLTAQCFKEKEKDDTISLLYQQVFDAIIKLNESDKLEDSDKPK